MDRRDVLMAAVIAVISVMTALCGYGMVQLFDDITGGDPLAHDCTYTFGGTVEDVPVSGTGESRYGKESDGLLVYGFSFRSDGDRPFSTSFSLVCDGDGRPTDEYSRIGTGPDGTEVWSLSEDGTTFTYYIGENCLVRHLTMISGSIDIRADITV